MSRRALSLGLLAVAVALLATVAARHDGAGPSGPDLPAGGGSAVTLTAPRRVAAAASQGGGVSAATAARARPVPRPRSLRGTTVDGGLVTDPGGRFVPTADARRLFDYFLTASGEEPEAAIVARIRAEIDRRLAGGAARDAHALLDRYLEYRERAREAAAAGSIADDLGRRLAALRALRVDVFGEETAALLFAEEEQIDAAAIERLRIEAAAIPEAERERRLAELSAGLPPAERVRRRQAEVALDLRRAEAELVSRGASPAELQRLREESVGTAAAARLAALDRRRAEWQARVDSYRAARDAILLDPTLDAAARTRAVDRLRAEHFDPTERLRVTALDEMGSHPGRDSP